MSFPVSRWGNSCSWGLGSLVGSANLAGLASHHMAVKVITEISQFPFFDNLYDCHMVSYLTVHPSPSHPPKGVREAWGDGHPTKGVEWLQWPKCQCQIDDYQWIVSNWRWSQNGVWWNEECQKIVSNWWLSEIVQYTSTYLQLTIVSESCQIDSCEWIVLNWWLSQNGVESMVVREWYQINDYQRLSSGQVHISVKLCS